jgi:hypothetical protein
LSEIEIIELMFFLSSSIINSDTDRKEFVLVSSLLQDSTFSNSDRCLTVSFARLDKFYWF